MTIQWSRRTYTKEQFINAWSDSDSIAEAARRLGLTIYGSTYSTLKSTAAELNLNQDHMTGQGWNVGGRMKPSPPRPIEQVLVKGMKFSSSKLKRRLLKEGLLKPECAAPYCPLPNPSVHPFTGEETELKLALDHINGDNTDNRLENLRLLCYHCHGLTDTFCRGSQRKGKKAWTPVGDPDKVCGCGGSKGKAALQCKSCDIESRRSGAGYENQETLFKCECGQPKNRKSAVCMNCHHKRLREGYKIDWPSDEELLERLSNSNYSRLARELGVSDNAIRKRLKRNKEHNA